MIFPNMVRRFDEGGEQNEQKKKKKNPVQQALDLEQDIERGLKNTYTGAMHAIGDDWRNLVYPAVTTIGGASLGMLGGGLLGYMRPNSNPSSWGKQSRVLKVPKKDKKAMANMSKSGFDNFVFDTNFTAQDLEDVKNGKISRELAAKLAKYSAKDNESYKYSDNPEEPNYQLIGPGEAQTKHLRTLVNKAGLRENIKPDPRVKELRQITIGEPTGQQYKFPQFNMESPINTWTTFRKNVLKPFMKTAHANLFDRINWGGQEYGIPTQPNPDARPDTPWAARKFADEKIKKENFADFQPKAYLKYLQDAHPQTKGKEFFSKSGQDMLNILTGGNDKENANYDPDAARRMLHNMGYGAGRSWKMAKPFIYNKFMRDYYKYGPELLTWAKMQSRQDPNHPQDVQFGHDPNTTLSRILKSHPEKVFKQYETNPTGWWKGPQYNWGDYLRGPANSADPYTQTGRDYYLASQKEFGLDRRKAGMSKAQYHNLPDYIDMTNRAATYQNKILDLANSFYNPSQGVYNYEGTPAII